MLIATVTLFVATMTPVDDFGSNPGALAMFEHVPANAREPMPLVLVLHGCTQDHAYADESGLVALADRYGVALVVAEQNSANNANACFNWFQSEDNTRDSGEAASLKQMIDAMKARHNIDDARVFVTGLSAGGAMTAVMLATYPDVFSAGVVFAGVPYGCASDVGSAFTCMYTDQNHSASQWAQLVDDASAASGVEKHAMPRIAVWAGTSDTTVMPVNADELVAQWTGVHALAATPTSTETWSSTNGDVSVSNYGVDDQGRAIVQSVRIPSMTHGTPIDVANGCGTAAPYVLDVGLCGSARAFEFFGIVTNDVVGAEGEGEGEADGVNASECTVSSCANVNGAPVLVVLLLFSAVRIRRRRKAD